MNDMIADSCIAIILQAQVSAASVKLTKSSHDHHDHSHSHNSKVDSKVESKQENSATIVKHPEDLSPSRPDTIVHQLLVNTFGDPRITKTSESESTSFK